VVPIQDPPTLAKVHQTYRLQYLKDVILARIIDDPTFSMLNSFIFFHQVDIVTHLQTDEPYLTELFGIFEEEPAPTAEPESADLIGPTLPPPAGSVSTTKADPLARQHSAILLLQQFCSLAKNLQLAARNHFYKLMGQRGLLRVLERALARTSPSLQAGVLADGPHSTKEEEMRIATIDILMMVIDHNPAGVRAYCLSKATLTDDGAPAKGTTRSLVLFLIDLLLSETDLGIQAQMAEAIKVLVSTAGEPIAAGPAEVRTLAK
jgi:protein phosphatase-4 regulatory subunit 3